MIEFERSRWEIIQDILKATSEGNKAKKTKIMLKASLDWRSFKRHFDLLVIEGFIAISNSSSPKNYEITSKGKELLNRLNKVSDLIGNYRYRI